jgi:photosystem II stability/assembly factor-like uncharacterized protein
MKSQFSKSVSLLVLFFFTPLSHDTMSQTKYDAIKKLPMFKTDPAVRPEGVHSPIVQETYLDLNENHVSKISSGYIEDLLQLVDGDSIGRTIQDLVAFKTRYIHSDSLDRAREYIQRRLSQYTQEVYLDTFAFSKNLWSMFVLKNPRQIWLGGEQGVILNSMDDGRSWTIRQQKMPDEISIFFLDSLRGWGAGIYENIYRTTDGGYHWTRIPLPGQYSSAILFADSLNGWIAGATDDGADLLKTSDGGLTWLPQALPPYPSPVNLLDICRATQDSLWVVGLSDQVICSSDGGTNWANIHVSNARERFTNVEFVGSKNGWISGANNDMSTGIVYRTTDNGLTWNKIVSFNNHMFLSISFCDTQHGWMGSMKTDWTGEVFSTQDGGDHWDKKLDTPNPIWNISAIDSDSCYAESFRGNVYQTTDGGETWSDSDAGSMVPSTGKNVIARINGTSGKDSIIVIGGHYDCTGGNPYKEAPGADDNASGVAAVIELARAYENIQCPYDMVFAAFSAEEIGLLGSDHYARYLNDTGGKIKGMFNFDMVGYQPVSKTWPVSLSTSRSFQWLGTLAKTMAETYTSLTPHTSTAPPNNTDSYSFHQLGFPTLSIDESAGNPYYHSQEDLYATLNIPYETEIVKMALATTASINGMTSSPVEEGHVFAGPYLPVLHGSYPNPFNARVRIGYYLPRSADVNLYIYNNLGRQVAVLVHEMQTPGEKSIQWDGRDRYGRDVGSGLYFYQLKIDGQKWFDKIALIR